MAQLNSGGEARAEAVAQLLQPELLRRLAFDAVGCRVVQTAIDVVDRQAASGLAAGLRGNVAEAIRSPHANYVLQKVIRVLAPQEVPFLVDELSGAGPDVARHEYGCRIFCRLLEHAASDERTAWLVDEALVETGELLGHPFGHHVIECALEHGLAHQRHHIITVVRKDVLQNAMNRHSAYVVEKALLHGQEEDRQALAGDLAGLSPNEVIALAQGQWGSMVVRTLLRIMGPAALRVQLHLATAAAQGQLRATKHGRRLLEDHLRISATAA